MFLEKGRRQYTLRSRFFQKETAALIYLSKPPQALLLFVDAKYRLPQLRFFYLPQSRFFSALVALLILAHYSL